MMDSQDYSATISRIAGFTFPSGANALLVEYVYRQIWKSPYWRHLAPYASVIQTKLGRVPDRFGPSHLLRSLPPRWAESLRANVSKLNFQPSSGRVLVVGEVQRATEAELMIRLLNGLVHAGYTVDYLLWFNRTDREALAHAHATNAWGDRVRLIAPLEGVDRLDRVGWVADAFLRAFTDWVLLRSLLPKGVDGGVALLRSMFLTARPIEVWQRMMLSRPYKAAFVQNHVRPLSAMVAFAAQDCGMPVTTFQQGVVSLATLYAPVFTDRILCSGPTSATLLHSLDQAYAHLSGRSPLCRSYVSVGAIIDDITPLSDQRRSRTLLVVDQMSAWSDRLYNLAEAHAELVACIEAACELLPLDRIVIRLHPYKPAIEPWARLIQRHPQRVSLSHNRNSLRSDLQETAIAVGLFSGGLISAAACGVPTLFLWKQGWFYTPDLTDFKQDLFVVPDQFVERVASLLTDPIVYDTACAQSLRAARLYYGGGKSFVPTPEILFHVVEHNLEIS